MVVKQVIEPDLDPAFLPDSYGYRPRKSALDAVGVVAYPSSMQRSPPVHRRGSGACPDTRRSNKPCATTISTHSVFPNSTSPPKLNPVEPPWYGPVCPVVGEGWHREVSPYPDPRRISPVAAHSGDRLLSEPTAATQPWRREPLFMPSDLRADRFERLSRVEIRHSFPRPEAAIRATAGEPSGYGPFPTHGQA